MIKHQVAYVFETVYIQKLRRILHHVIRWKFEVVLHREEKNCIELLEVFSFFHAAYTAHDPYVSVSRYHFDHPGTASA